jgi:alpha-tubulin suppressor-like RCC1 family protein
LDTGTNWTQFSTSDYGLLALKSDGTLWIHRQNVRRSAGDHTKGAATNFIQIGTNTDWHEVHAGHGYFFARKDNGSWLVCGDNYRGARGFGAEPSDTDSPIRRLPLDIEPWAFSTSPGNTLLLTHDGNLWTWGERPGSTAPTALSGLKQFSNRLIGSLPGHWQKFPLQGPLIDSTPYRLWELPPEIRRTLGTNSNTQNTR